MMASSLVMNRILACRYPIVKRSANTCVRHLDEGRRLINAMTTIGKRVRYLRKLRGYSHVELSALVGITQGSLSLIERDETEVPAGSTVAGLCRILKTTPDFLIAGAGDPDSIASAVQEHELVYLWRDLPEEARRLVLDNAHAVKRAFGITETKK